MQQTKPRYRHLLAVLLACALPGLALSAPPSAPAPERVLKPAASQVKAKTGQSQGDKKARRPPNEPAKQPYQPLVDTVRKSTETFRDENVSESADRDRLPDPPGR